MYQAFTFYHSTVRWLVLASLIYAIFRAYRGYRSNAVFSKTDNAVRHWTATIAHVQLMLGLVLYFQSPLIKYFFANFKETVWKLDFSFFGLLHSLMMLLAVVVLTIGSALAKRKTNDRDKFKTMLLWFSLSLLLIFIAIPWPFSPLAQRPYFR